MDAATQAADAPPPASTPRRLLSTATAAIDDGDELPFSPSTPPPPPPADGDGGVEVGAEVDDGGGGPGGSNSDSAFVRLLEAENELRKREDTFASPDGDGMEKISEEGSSAALLSSRQTSIDSREGGSGEGSGEGEGGSVPDAAGLSDDEEEEDGRYFREPDQTQDGGGGVEAAEEEEWEDFMAAYWRRKRDRASNVRLSPATPSSATTRATTSPRDVRSFDPADTDLKPCPMEPELDSIPPSSALSPVRRGPIDVDVDDGYDDSLHGDADGSHLSEAGAQCALAVERATRAGGMEHLRIDLGMRAAEARGGRKERGSGGGPRPSHGRRGTTPSQVAPKRPHPPDVAHNRSSASGSFSPKSQDASAQSGTTATSSISPKNQEEDGEEGLVTSQTLSILNSQSGEAGVEAGIRGAFVPPVLPSSEAAPSDRRSVKSSTAGSDTASAGVGLAGGPGSAKGAPSSVGSGSDAGGGGGANRKHKASKTTPLPSPDLVLMTGPILTRTSLRALVMKKWHPSYWMRYGPTTLLVFRSKDHMDDWRYNPYHGKRQRDFLVKLKIDFKGDMEGGGGGGGAEGSAGGGKEVLGHRILPIKKKSYGKNEEEV